MFVRRYPLPCRTGVMADAMSGIRMIWDEEQSKYILDPIRRKVNKKLLHEVFAETYGIKIVDGKKALHYILARGDKINKRGLNTEQVYSMTVFPDGKHIEEGDRTLWIQHHNDLCDGLLSMEFLERCVGKFSSTCWEVFQMPPVRLHCEGIHELMEKVFSGALEEQLKTVAFRDGFGFELEFTGITRRKAADIVAGFFGTDEVHTSRLRRYVVLDTKNREWMVDYDGSIQATCGKVKTDNRDYRCELVSPICNYKEDMKTIIQPLIRALRDNGAVVYSSCGFHVHVSDNRFSPTELQRLLLLFSEVEDLMFDALSVRKNRQLRYCGKTDEGIVHRLQETKVNTMEDLSYCWYGTSDCVSEHYHDSRYVALNYHSLFHDKGIEYRLFNSSLHAGKIRSYIVLALALTNLVADANCMGLVKKLEGDSMTKMLRLLDILGITECPEYHNIRVHLLRALKNSQSRLDAA